MDSIRSSFSPNLKPGWIWGVILKGKFLLFAGLLFVSNTVATGCGYLFFYLSSTLPLFGGSQTFTMFALSISRLTMLGGLWAFSRFADRVSKSRLAIGLGALSSLTFVVLAGSGGWGSTLIGCLLYGFSGIGPIILGAYLLEMTPEAWRLPTFSWFSASYSCASFLASWGVSEAREGVSLQSFSSFPFWRWIEPWKLSPSWPGYIFLLGGVFSIFWMGSVFLARIWQKFHLFDRGQAPLPGSSSLEESSPREYGILIPWAIIVGLLWIIPFDLVPGYAGVLGLPTGSLGFFSAFGLFAILSRLIVLPFLSFTSRKVLFPLCVLSYTLCLVLLWGVGTFPALWIFSLAGACLGLAHGSLHTLLNVAFVDRTPRSPGRATLIYMLLFNGAGLLSLFLTLWIDLLGRRGVILLLLLDLAVLVRISRKYRNFLWKERSVSLSGKLF